MRDTPTTADAIACPGPRPMRRPNVRRWTLVALGVACVLLAGVGVAVPGLPTTVFLISASWCFTRSCPWLEERLIRNRFFRPYLRFLDGDAPMPRRVMWATLTLMWVAIAISTLLLASRDVAIALVLSVPFAGLVGTGFIVRLARPRPSRGIDPAARCPFIPE